MHSLQTTYTMSKDNQICPLPYLIAKP